MALHKEKSKKKFVKEILFRYKLPVQMHTPKVFKAYA